MATAATVLVAAGAAPVVTGPVATAQAAPRDTTPPSVPGNFRTTGSTPTSVSLAWTASTDNKGVAGYRLTRTNADGGGVVVRNIGTATSYTDNGLNSGWTYVYSLQALDAAGNASGSTSKVTVVVPASQSDTTPPSVPANFRTTGSTPTSVALGWTASTDDRGVAGYRLTRTHADGGGGVVRDVGNVTSYTDNGLNSGWTYVYSLQAVDAAGNVSGSTSKVTVLVPSAPASGGGTDGGSTGGSTGGTSPSGESMPTGDMAGWKQIFSDDFTTNVPLGKFPSAVANKWDAYPYPWTGTPTTGTYSPERTTSVANGMMDIWLHSEVVDGVMKHLISAPEPRINGPAPAGLGQLYGRYAVRFKTDKFPYYKPSWLLWPTSETWPRDGEIDFPEGNFDGNICGFMHRQGGTSGSDQDAYCTSTPVAGAWHTAVIEWLPNHLRLLLDGKVIGESTSRVPNTPMRYVLQNGVRFDTPNPDNATQGHVYIDWVAVYKPA